MNFRKHLEPVRAFAIAAALGAFVAASPASATSITYNNFSSTAGLTLVGNAGTTTTGDGTVLRVTPATGNQAGAAYSTSAVTLGASNTFSTQFQFRFTNPGGSAPADGITFVLAAGTTGLGGLGVGMGYSGVQHSIAIEFDTYNNAGFGLGNNDGNSSNHVAVDTNGNLTNSAIASPYGKQTCDFSGGSNYTAPGCMTNGDVWTVNIGYDGTYLNVTMRDGAMAAQNLISNYAIDIASIIGTNSAYVGFTAASGAGWANHDILNWSFSDTTVFTNPVPAPGALMLLAFGLLGVGGLRRKAKAA
jgi:hypothetical protein